MDAVVSAREPQYRSDQNQNRSPDRQATLGSDELRRMNAYWRAANYLSVGQIYLYDNPLLKEPLKLSHVKPLVVGHWGTTPGQNFIYVHLNRVIKKYDLDMFYIAGPGHGGPAIVGNVYLEGTWSEIYPNITQDEAGLKKLFKQFSFPGGISSHVAPTTPGSIHEGGELGYSLSHAFGAAFDNPDLIVACVIGDGEAETGPLATAWQSNKLLDPITDGAVLPILHLNGYKISNPTVLARIEHEELEQFLRGCGWTPYFVEGDDPEKMHRTHGRRPGGGHRGHPANPEERAEQGCRHPAALADDRAQVAQGLDRAERSSTACRSREPSARTRCRCWWMPSIPNTSQQLESWMKSYKAEELFDEQGRLMPELAELAPKGDRRMGANPHTNGGILLRDLRMPDFHAHAVHVPSPGAVDGQDTLVLGKFLRDVAKLNQEQRNFRIFGPDETLSNLLGAVFEVTNRQWDAREVDERRVPRARRTRAGLDAQRAPVRGLAGRLSADRPARAVQQLRGLHPHRRLDVQPACQVAEGDVGAAVAPQDRLAELSARLACLAAGSQRLHPPGSRLPRPRHQQEGRHRARLPAARCQLPAVGV